MTRPVKLLFICSRNQWRSPTAEEIFRKRSGYQARSAGTSSKAKKTVGVSDLQWADIVFVMEKKHRNRLMADFSRILEYKAVHVLDIPDEYQYMDPELIEELDVKVVTILESDISDSVS